MMGGHHAACGAAAWVALASTAPFALGWYPVSPLGVLTGTLVTAGAALLPDLDHRSGTIANSLPPLTKVLAGGIETISGGHRRGTHSLLGAAVFILTAIWLGLATADVPGFGDIAVGAGILSVLLMGFALKSLKLAGGPVQSWLLALGLSCFIAVNAPQQHDWLPIAVGLGVLAHLVGDLITTGGIMLLWPLRLKRPRRFARIPGLRDIWKPGGSLSIPLLGGTGSRREWALLVPVSLYAIYGVTDAGFRWLAGLF